MRTALPIALCSAALLVSGCATSNSNATAWEYKVVGVDDYTGKLQSKLNELAGEGWVVVSVSTSLRDQTGQVPYSYVVLKRHKK